MATATYNCIATTTLGGHQTDVTFTSISGSYTDLVLICDVVGITTNHQNLALRVGNGSIDTGSNYSNTTINGDGTSAVSDRYTGNNLIYPDYWGIVNSASRGNAIMHFMNYSNTTTYKTVLCRSGRANMETSAVVGLWRSTSAINQIRLVADSTNKIGLGSTFSLYGIKSE